jgi:peptide deformylase
MMSVAKKKVALGILKGNCEVVENPEEAQVIVGALEEVLGSDGSLSAPEINIKKQVAIIRTRNYSIDLINPAILERKNQLISFEEKCSSFEEDYVNCLRYRDIVVRNGFDGKVLTFSGEAAILVQHEVDHLSGKTFFDRAIKAALVRDGGNIHDKDPCPCGSRKRFWICCKRS